MTEESSESTGSSTPAEKKDLVAGFKNMGATEKLVAVGAAGFLLAFLVKSEVTWKSLFKFGNEYIQAWWMTLGFLGAIGVLVLIVTRLMGVKLVDAKLWPKLVLVCAAAPAVGWVIDSLQNFWLFLMMVSTAVLAFGASKLIASKD